MIADAQGNDVNLDASLTFSDKRVSLAIGCRLCLNHKIATADEYGSKLRFYLQVKFMLRKGYRAKFTVNFKSRYKWNHFEQPPGSFTWEYIPRCAQRNYLAIVQQGVDLTLQLRLPLWTERQISCEKLLCITIHLIIPTDYPFNNQFQTKFITKFKAHTAVKTTLT